MLVPIEQFFNTIACRPTGIVVSIEPARLLTWLLITAEVSVLTGPRSRISVGIGRSSCWGACFSNMT